MNHVVQTNDLLSYIQNQILCTLQDSLSIVPDSALDFKPEGDLNSLRFLFYHVVNGPFIYLSGLQKKEFTEADFKAISIDFKKITSFKDLLEYYNTFNSFIDDLKDSLKAKDLDQSINYNFSWGNWSLTGQRALETAFEEIIHHRAQIYIYMRMLGLKPPLIYPYL